MVEQICDEDLIIEAARCTSKILEEEEKIDKSVSLPKAYPEELKISAIEAEIKLNNEQHLQSSEKDLSNKDRLDVLERDLAKHSEETKKLKKSVDELINKNKKFLDQIKMKDKEEKSLMKRKKYYKNMANSSLALEESISKLDRSINELKDENAAVREWIQDFENKINQNSSKVRKLEENESKSMMREIISELKKDVLKELSGYLDKKCFGMKDVLNAAAVLGINKGQIDAFICTYLDEYYNIKPKTYESILKMKKQLNHFIHASTPIYNQKLKDFLGSLPQDNQYKEIYDSMEGFIKQKTAKEMSKTTPNNCYKCGAHHDPKNCKICWFCDEYGHIKDECPRRIRNRPPS